MKVALQVTCVNDAMFPETGRATVRLLRRLGVDVAIVGAPFDDAWASRSSSRPARHAAGSRW